MRTPGTATLAAFLIAMVFVTAACGSDDSSDSAAGGDAGTQATAGGDGTADAKALEEKFSKLTGVKYPQPTEPVEPGKRKLAIISCGNAASACLNGGKAAKEAAEAIGWESTDVLDGKLTPSVVSGQINDAVERGYDAILIFSFDVGAVKAAVDKAVAKDVKIACVVCVGNDPESGVWDVGTNGTVDGEAIGAHIAANADPDAKALVYDDPAYPAVKRRIAGVKEVIGKYRSDIEIEAHDVATADLAKPGPPFFTAALSSNPKGSLDWVVAPYGTIAQPMLKTLVDQGRTEIKVASFDGITANTDQLAKADSPYVADTAAAFSYFSWAAVDVLARVLAEQDVWDGHNEMPIALLTKDNIADAALDKESGFFEPTDFDYKAMLKKLWGVS